MSLAPYRRVLAIPGVRSLLLGGLMARMAYAAMGLALILYVRFGLELGYFEAGLAGAAFVTGGALGSTLWGRVADRSGLRPVLAITSVGMGVFWLSLVFLPFPVLLGAALVGGLFNLPVFVVVRQPLAAMVPEESRRSAFSLDSTLVEITFMIGPAVATTMAATAAPAVTPIAIGIWAPLAGALLWWINPGTSGAPEEVRPPRPPMRQWLNGPVAAMLVAGVGTTMALGGSDVAIVSLLEHNGEMDQAWIVMSVWAAYSLSGGLIFGTMHRDVNPLLLLGVMGAATIPLGLLGQWWLVALLLLPAGIVTAPTIAASVDKVSKLVPASVRGEAMGMHGSAMTIGIAVGGPLVGWSVDYLGPQWGFVTAGSGAVAAAIAAAVLMRLRRVTPAEPAPAPA